MEEVCFELRKKGEVSGNLSFRNWKILKISVGMKNFPNLMLDPLSSQKTKCSLTPKLLSHSPKEKWRNLRLIGSKYGVYIHVGRWMVTQESL
jgi:hypothetical protein